MPNEFLSHIREDLAEPDRTRKLNRDLFTMVASRYDAATRYLSIGRDSCWKDRLVSDLPEKRAPVCIDLACGTGDITRRLALKYPDGRIIGLDLTEAMLEGARQLAVPPNLKYELGDMGRTGLDDASVDIVTGGYALRNAGDLQEVIREVYRILKPGGTAVFLDFSKSANPLLQAMALGVLKLWGGAWGLILHRDARVYAYIADSLARYPDRLELSVLFREAGFVNMRASQAYAGLIECISLEKP